MLHFSPDRRLAEYSSIRPFVDQALSLVDAPKSSQILELGCGNSAFTERMYDDGYRNITGIDISASAVAQMQTRNASSRKELAFAVMDVKELKFPSASLDLVVDKGTLDAVLCGDNPNFSAALMIKASSSL